MRTRIRNVRVFDGTRLWDAPADVMFDETGILENDSAPADVEIDGTGKTLTPGLMDGHVHMGGEGMEPPATDAGLITMGAVLAAQAQSLWRYGITTVRNCGTGKNADLAVRDAIRAGKCPGVRILGCGRVVCITGGHGWPMGWQADTVDEARKAARTQLRDGADFVKLMATGGMGTKGSVPNAPQLTEAQMHAAVEEAALVGRFTAAHCTGLEGAQRAIRAGVHIIEHAQLDEETARMMAESGAAYCPTIVTRYNILHTEDPRYQWMRAKADPGDLVRKRQALAHCKAMSIPVLAGTDAGPNPMTPLGESLWRELGIYCEYGMTPVEALHAATAGAAAILGLADCTGSIRPGLAADLALFDGNPAEDITRLNTLCRTWQGGVQRFQH